MSFSFTVIGTVVGAAVGFHVGSFQSEKYFEQMDSDLQSILDSFQNGVPPELQEKIDLIRKNNQQLLRQYQSSASGVLVKINKINGELSIVMRELKEKSADPKQMTDAELNIMALEINRHNQKIEEIKQTYFREQSFSNPTSTLDSAAVQNLEECENNLKQLKEGEKRLLEDFFKFCDVDVIIKELNDPFTRRRMKECKKNKSLTIERSAGEINTENLLSSSLFVNVKQIDGDITMENNQSLRMVVFRELEKVGGNIRFEGNSFMTKIAFTKLQIIEHEVKRTNNENLVFASFPLVLSMVGKVIINSNGPDLEVDLGNLTGIFDNNNLMVENFKKLTVPQLWQRVFFDRHYGFHNVDSVRVEFKNAY
eukprot:gene179-155_t